MKKHLFSIITCALLFCFCNVPKQKALDSGRVLQSAGQQYLHMAGLLSASRDSIFPKTWNRYMERLVTSPSDWWCSGFYPGTLFQLYRATGDEVLWDEGIRMLGLLAPEQYNTRTHDVGFMIYCSFGTAAAIRPNPAMDTIIMNGARSLCTRFNPAVGCLRSHDRGPEEFGVIIDNMMNLEILFRAAEMSGEKTFYDIAVTHANTTLKNHFRKDGSLYHAVQYDPVSGKILGYQAGQGYSRESPWARGQAWGLYGFTMAYRFTGDTRYLEAAYRIADYIFAHPNMPVDGIPYWDFDAPGVPDTLRDASAAAIISSALLELAGYVDPTKSDDYTRKAAMILSTLASPLYTAPPGANGGFILMHSAGNIPAGTEVDVPLTYADYYYVEALARYNDIINEQ